MASVNHNNNINYRELFQENRDSLSNYSRIALLKQIESVTRQVFTSHEALKQVRESVGQDQTSQQKLLKAALSQNFDEFTDFTPEFYLALGASSVRQELSRQFISMVLDPQSGISHGFNTLDTILIKHSAIISSLYDVWYSKWSRAVQGNATADALNKCLKNGTELNKELFNHYTIITLKSEDPLEFTQQAYATYFKQEIADIVQAFDNCISELKQIEESDTTAQLYIAYLTQYRNSLAETDQDKLEELWADLDRKWMDIKYYIQIVHDIEYGYGDPMRIKAIPDFSLRFVDEEYSTENEFIKNDVQQTMLDYFKKRGTDLANKGLFAVGNSMCGIYYLPFNSGMSLHFRFSGQSIPNRSEVKNVKGVKIYFDPVSTEQRILQTAQLVKEVFADSEDIVKRMSPVDTILYHVSAHEIGHAIYNLDAVKECISAPTKTLLEEPRAELTALTTMKLLFEAGQISKEQMTKTLSSFAAQDLRRFSAYDSTSTRPYIISAISCYGIYERLQYMTLQDDRVVIHDDKALQVLTEMQTLFEKILTAEDNREGEQLEQILKNMQQESNLVKFLVSKLFESKK